MGVSTWRHILQGIVIVRPFLRLLNYVSLQSAKLISRCHDVLDHGLNLHRNIPLITVKATKWKPSLPLLSSPLSCSKWSECVPRSKRLEIRVSIMVASVHLHASPHPQRFHPRWAFGWVNILQMTQLFNVLMEQSNYIYFARCVF